MVEIIPSILSKNALEAENLLTNVNGYSKRVSVDVVDGVFANNKTVDPLLFSELMGDFLFEYQLMVDQPVNWIEKCIRGGAETIIGHIEMMENQTEFVGKVQGAGKRVGLALDLKTEVGELEKTIIKDIDVVLLMSVNAGFGGQKFDRSVFGKVEALNKIRKEDKSPFRIQIDGGVTPEIMKDIVASRVDEVSVGRRLFDGDVGDNIDKYKKAAYD